MPGTNHEARRAQPHAPPSLVQVLGQVTPQTCPTLPPINVFELASPFLSLALTGGGGATNDAPYYFPIDKGVQLVDINGDLLADIVWGYEDQSGAAPHPQWTCIYLNTGCSWVFQSNFSGRDTSCAEADDIDLRGVSFSFRGLTVAQFAAEVAEYFGLPAAEVRVRSGDRRRLDPNVPLGDAATSPGGFRVTLGHHPDGEEYEFRGRRGR